MTEPQDDARVPEDEVEPYAPTSASWNAPLGTTRVEHRSFTPRWGRIGVAAVGLIALVAALVTFVLAIVGPVSLLVPLLWGVVAAAAVAVLRTLAVRDRRARVERAFAAAMAPSYDFATGPTAAPRFLAAPDRPTALFDAEETPVRPLTVMERRTAALATAHGSSVVDVRDAEPAAGRPAAAAWEPVEVPRPTYIDAAKAERQAPAPLDLPEAPKPTSKMPIKASEAAARVVAAEEDTVEDVLSASTPAAGRIDLDDVLQRRRA